MTSLISLLCELIPVIETTDYLILKYGNGVTSRAAFLLEGDIGGSKHRNTAKKKKEKINEHRITARKGSFSKPRRRRRRDCHQTKGLTRKTIAVHVRFESLYISLPSSATQQRGMTKLYVFWRTRSAMANFLYLLLELNAVGAC